MEGDASGWEAGATHGRGIIRMQILETVMTLRCGFTHHRASDVCEATLGFALGKLKRVDVLQTGFIFPHLLTDNQLHTAKG